MPISSPALISAGPWKFHVTAGLIPQHDVGGKRNDVRLPFPKQTTLLPLILSGICEQIIKFKKIRSKKREKCFRSFSLGVFLAPMTISQLYYDFSKVENRRTATSGHSFSAHQNKRNKILPNGFNQPTRKLLFIAGWGNRE